MRGVAMALCWCAFTAAPALAVRTTAPLAFSGEWVGSRNGELVIWTLDEDGRLRVDGRGANYTIHGDSIVVVFDAPTGEPAGARPETAIYQFTPDDTATKLFVRGFDLGRQGVLLFRTPPTETARVAEDAAPPAPPEPGPMTPVAPAEPAPPPHQD